MALQLHLISNVNAIETIGMSIVPKMFPERKVIMSLKL